MKEENKKFKKLESLTKYFIYPNTRFFGGYIHNGDNIYLCDDNDSMSDEEGKENFKINVKQRIENDILYTDIKSTRIYKNGMKQNDTIHQELELKKGQLLVYVEHQGFVISEYKMVTVDEAKKIYDILGGNKNDSGANKG